MSVCLIWPQNRSTNLLAASLDSLRYKARAAGGNVIYPWSNPMTEHNNKSQSVEIKPLRKAFDTAAPMRKYTYQAKLLVSTFFYSLGA